MKGLIIGSLLAGLAMFVWGFLFWGTPLSSGAFNTTSNYDEIGASLNELLPADGAYHVPWYGVDEAEMLSLHERGPLATIHFRRAGAPMGAPGVMVLGFLQMVATAFLLAFLLRGVAATLPAYGQRVGFVALVGLAATIWFDFAGPIWWYESMTFAVYNGVYDVISFAVAGLVLARFVKREEGVLESA